MDNDWIQKTGGSAFPIGGNENFEAEAGMTLRDWFAGQAINNMSFGHYKTGHELALDAFKIADAMLNARKL